MRHECGLYGEDGSEMTKNTFGRCCMCRKEIPYEAQYYRCSVGTCNLGRIKLLFCSIKCWEDHLPTARHKSADYVTESAPKKSE